MNQTKVSICTLAILWAPNWSAHANVVCKGGGSCHRAEKMNAGALLNFLSPPPLCLVFSILRGRKLPFTGNLNLAALKWGNKVSPKCF